MLGVNVGMGNVNVRKCYEVLIGANIWMLRILGMLGMLGSFDRCKYMNVCISKFMYVCICNIFLVLKSWEF